MKSILQKRLTIIIFVGLVETILVSWLILSIPTDPKNAVLWGLSTTRLLNVLVLLGLAMGLLIILMQRSWLQKFETSIEAFLSVKDNWKKVLLGVIILAYTIFVVLQVPSYQLKKIEYVWERVYPNILLLELFSINFLGYVVWVGVLKSYFPKIEKPTIVKAIKYFWPFFLFGLGLVLFVGISTVGIIEDDYHWNTAGVPVLGFQVLVVFWVYLVLIGIKGLGWVKKYRTNVSVVFVLLWICASVIWIAQPIARNYFVYQAKETIHEEYYPKSDAQRFDQGARLMLLGEGIYGGITEEKPFLMAVISGIRAVGGGGYQTDINVQVVLLALMIPGLFLIGRELYSNQFGIAVSILGILYEINTFGSSGYINNVHVKLFMSEPYTLFGVIWVTYFFIRWMKNPEKLYLGLITFGLTGFFSFVRTNNLGLLVFVFVLAIVIPKTKWLTNIKRTVLASSAIFAINLPWAVYAYLKYGYIVVLNKLDFVLRTRFLEVNSSISETPKIAKLSLVSVNPVVSFGAELWDSLYVIVSHMFNNLIKSILIFPTSIKFDRISIVLDKPYWDERIVWDGRVGILFFINLLILVIGIAYLNKKRQLIGVIPFLLSMAYYITLAFGRTSGGRYMSPGIWAFYLYYLAGLFFVFEWVLGIAGIDVNMFFELKSKKPKVTARGSQITMVTILLVGILIPLTNEVIPQKYSDYSRDELIEILNTSPEFNAVYLNDPEFASLLSRGSWSFYHGEVWYGVREADPDIDDLYWYHFSILGPKIARQAHLVTSEILTQFPDGEEVIGLGCPEGRGENMLFVYFVNGGITYQTDRNFQEICLVE